MVGCFLCISLYCFLQRRPSIDISALSFFVSLRTLFAENEFDSRSYAVSLLWCLAFLCWQLGPWFFVDFIVSAMHRKTTIIRAGYRCIFLTRFPWFQKSSILSRGDEKTNTLPPHFLNTWTSAFLCSSHIPGMHLAASTRAFFGTIATLETSSFAFF